MFRLLYTNKRLFLSSIIGEHCIGPTQVTRTVFTVQYTVHYDVDLRTYVSTYVRCSTVARAVVVAQTILYRKISHKITA